MGGILARLRALRGNRWALAGLAGAAGLGGLALVRRGHAAPGSDTADAGDIASTSAGAGGQGQFPNTYQTDLATAVGDLDSRYAESLSDFSGQLGTNAAAVAALTTTTTKQAADLASVTKKVSALTTTPKPTTVKKPTTTKKPASSKTTPKTTWKTITIKRGDTLGAIAKKYHTSVGALAQENKIKNVNLISAGRKLKVPG